MFDKIKKYIFIFILAIYQFISFVLKEILIESHSIEVYALEFTLYFFTMPCIIGVLLKFIIKNKVHSVFVLALSGLASCFCIAAFNNGGHQMFFAELLMQILTFPTIFLGYCITCLLIKNKKNIAIKIIVASVSILLLSLVLFGLASWAFLLMSF